jgi:NAD-dependent dihydropyrimidine dehydrogenase PreA subunit
MPEIRVISERCVACGDCVGLCPQSGGDVEPPVLVVAESGTVEVADPQGCIFCFTCVEFCRSAAITITGSPTGAEGQPDVYPTRPVSRII